MNPQTCGSASSIVLPQGSLRGAQDRIPSNLALILNTITIVIGPIPQAAFSHQCLAMGTISTLFIGEKAIVLIKSQLNGIRSLMPNP